METSVPTFLADVHLGRLARSLRMLGFDTLYSNSFTGIEIRRLAREQNRVLLSRHAPLAKNPFIQTCIVRSEDYVEQLKQVVGEFSLTEKLRPFSRCLVCNSTLVAVAKEAVSAQLEENTRKSFQEFWQCESCRRIYWKGSHFERMEKLIKHLKESPH